MRFEGYPYKRNANIVEASQGYYISWDLINFKTKLSMVIHLHVTDKNWKKYLIKIRKLRIIIFTEYSKFSIYLLHFII